MAPVGCAYADAGTLVTALMLPPAITAETAVQMMRKFIVERRMIDARWKKRKLLCRLRTSVHAETRLRLSEGLSQSFWSCQDE